MGHRGHVGKTLLTPPTDLARALVGLGCPLQVNGAVSLEESDHLNCPPGSKWMLAERWVDESRHVGGVVRLIGVTTPASWPSQDEPVTHYHLHLFARAFMLGHAYPLGFGQAHCLCPTGESDVKWYMHEYLPQRWDMR
jgi:hypothetical protein